MLISLVPVRSGSTKTGVIFFTIITQKTENKIDGDSIFRMGEVGFGGYKHAGAVGGGRGRMGSFGELGWASGRGGSGKTLFCLRAAKIPFSFLVA